MGGAVNNVVIGIAQMGYVACPSQITTYALGSCVGVVLYDKVQKSAGMVHILLPELKADKQGPAGASINKAKYANMGIQELYDQMLRHGSRHINLCAKMAGGAHMFGKPMANNDMLNVGQRNIAECKRAIMKISVPIVAEDTAGQYGRTITFDTATGMLHVKTVGRGEKYI